MSSKQIANTNIHAQVQEYLLKRMSGQSTKCQVFE